MADVWVIAEARNEELRPSTFELLGIARELAAGGTAAVVLLGSGVADKAGELGPKGADLTLAIDDPELAQYSPDGWSRVVAKLASDRNPDVILTLASARGREIGPRVAAELGVGLLSDVVELRMSDGGLEAVRPIYAGRALATVRLTGSPLMATLRPSTFAPSEEAGRGEVEAVPLGEYTPGAKATKLEVVASERPDVAEADIIVTGGRGMGGPEHFQLIEELADTLGAATGASRAVVDAGWRPHSQQVGQTGKTVSPTLYVACGVSGAVQHVAGMKTSKTIVAVNKDPEAPIFGLADYGIVGDVFEILPLLTEAVRRQKGS